MQTVMRWLAGGSVYVPLPDGARFVRADLAMEDGRIVEVTAPGRAGEDVVDAEGLFLLPGLIDCHVHLVMRGEDADPAASATRTDAEIAASTVASAERTILGGLTTVRDVGGWNYVEMGLREDIEAGIRPGPRLVLAGRLLSAPTEAVEYYPGMYRVVRGQEDVRLAAREQLERGADLIKVMATGAMLSPEGEDAGETQLTREELLAAVEEAEAAGGHVAAHAHARKGIEDAVLAGARSIEHGTFADEGVLRLMAERGTFLVPTLSVSSAMIRDQRVMAETPPHIRTRMVEHQRVHVEAVRLAHRLGVPIAMGTDAGTPGNHHGANAGECVAMVEEIGMSAEQSIASATSVAAELLGRTGELGELTAGAAADVIGLGEDPRRDIRALTRPALVVKGGEIVTRPI
jgi:imidazolonepropionase-like amidohydrolase